MRARLFRIDSFGGRTESTKRVVTYLLEIKRATEFTSWNVRNVTEYRRRLDLVIIVAVILCSFFFSSREEGCFSKRVLLLRVFTGEHFSSRFKAV